MTVHAFPNSPVEVIVYGRPGCQQCRTTTQHLDRLGIPFVYRDVTQDPLWSDTVAALGYQSLPVVTAGDMHWSGYRNTKLKRLAEIHGVASDIGWLPEPLTDDILRADMANGWAPHAAELAAELLAARARITELEADQRNVRQLIDNLTDPDDCSFDHHGGCQAHNHLEPDQQCPNETAKQWLAAHQEAGA